MLAHCGSALAGIAAGNPLGFSPEDNQRAVDQRSPWALDRVLDELFTAYAGAVSAIDAAGGRLDGVGLGEWIHGGDVREPLGLPDPYASAGSDLAVSLISARSVDRSAPAVEVVVDGQAVAFGVGDPEATLTTDTETFVRLVSGRSPAPDRYRLAGVEPAAMVLFT